MADQYHKTGRGGAGNFLSPKGEDSTAAAKSHTTPSYAHHTGRGGAGNEQQPAAPTHELRDEAARREVEERVRCEVEARLARPGRTYAGGTR